MNAKYVNDLKSHRERRIHVTKKRLKRKDNTKEMTERFLKNEGKFDFGKNWMGEIDTI